MRTIRLRYVIASVCVALFLITTSVASAEKTGDGKAAATPIPLPADVAKDLAILGKGVVGKPLPPPVIDDIAAYLSFGPGDWHYTITHDPKQGRKVRVESYARIEGPKGNEAWKRSIGDEYVEYLEIRPDGSGLKYAEDDPDVGYGCDIVPGILVKKATEAGVAHDLESQLEAFKLDDRKDVKFKGTAKSHFTYVGAYEVKTPAGTFPAVLVQNVLEIHIGPAKVTDTQYAFYSKGVGKVAEVETLNIAAVLIYHSSSEIGKLLSDWPGSQKHAAN